MTHTGPVDSSKLLESIFEKHERQMSFSDSLEDILCNEHVAICRDFDATFIQESWSWRNTHTARELAKKVIDEKGEISHHVLESSLQIVEKNLYGLGPGREHDSLRYEHIVSMLKGFYENKEYAYALKRVFKPSGHQAIEKIIRETLFLPDGTQLTDSHARQAAFSSLLCLLRQNVGSCFATAPAILIQQDQPLNFLADISQLFGTGRLNRTYEGIEYVVPLNINWGVGDLLKPILLSTLGKNPLKVLSFSPGLQAAFSAAGLLDSKLKRHEKQKNCEKFLREATIPWEFDNPFFAIHADQIIKSVLVHFFGITEKDLSLYKGRMTPGPFAEMVIYHPKTQSSFNGACSRYFKAYEAAKWAFKALTDNPLLKGWEFTLASLSESKADFAKWNLYISLGVKPEEPFGIGQCIYEILQNKIREINQQLQEFQSNYDYLFSQAKYLEGRMSRGVESDSGWTQAEYQIRRHEIDRLLNQRDELYEKGSRLQSLYPPLIEFYGKKIRDYFQEVYDAEMHDLSPNAYDDSPAGFRLLYKHGRSHTALWSMVNSAAEYIQNLTSFFVSTEIELAQLPEVEGLQKEISELVTAIIQTIKRSEFMETSFLRLARAYQEPLINNPMQNLDQIKRKPWSYISGGNLSTLVSCYWSRPQKPQEKSRWVESPNELFAFFVDTLKESAQRTQRRYQLKPTLGMFAFSPTHAFVCKPGWPLFRQAWESDLYTYTWIRDIWALPQHRFLDSIRLDSRIMDVILQQLLLYIPSGYRALVKNILKDISFELSPSELRERIIKMLSYEKWLKGEWIDLIAEEIDSILYRFLPCFPEHALRDKLHILFDAIEEVDAHVKQQIFKNLDEVEEDLGKYKILTAQDLKYIAKGLLMMSLKKTRTSINYHQKILQAMQNNGLCHPHPFLFADTNWIKNVFGFVINPGTRNLEFWRFDTYGDEGRPISQWKNHLNGVSKEAWGLYTASEEYGQI